MSIYAIGDVQGCIKPLQELLALIGFNQERDTLWFVGDLVNRGPESLEVLRFVKELGNHQRVVLGNHDLHLLAVAYGVVGLKPQDTLLSILEAPDRDELINWLRHRPLLHFDPQIKYVMTHAGLAPLWSLQKAQVLAREVEKELSGPHPELFLQHMYGDKPSQWTEALSGWERLRCIVNYFTRMRYCYADGSLELGYKGKIENKPAHLIPWFEVVNRQNKEDKIVFGHWAALGGETAVQNVFPIDTGCVWGNCLTALRLDDEKIFKVNCVRE